MHPPTQLPTQPPTEVYHGEVDHTGDHEAKFDEEINYFKQRRRNTGRRRRPDEDTVFRNPPPKQDPVYKDPKAHQRQTRRENFRREYADQKRRQKKKPTTGVPPSQETQVNVMSIVLSILGTYAALITVADTMPDSSNVLGDDVLFKAKEADAILANRMIHHILSTGSAAKVLEE
jgi:hypothetical protein